MLLAVLTVGCIKPFWSNRYNFCLGHFTALQNWVHYLNCKGTAYDIHSLAWYLSTVVCFPLIQLVGSDQEQRSTWWYTDRWRTQHKHVSLPDKVGGKNNCIRYSLLIYTRGFLTLIYQRVKIIEIFPRSCSLQKIKNKTN